MLGHGPISGGPISALHEWRFYVYSYSTLVAQESQFTALYAATREFVTRADDSPVLVGQAFFGTLDSSIRIDRSVISGTGFNGYVQNVSELALINDGEYDVTLDTSSVSGQTITLKIGEYSGNQDARQNYSEFESLAILTGESWRLDRSKVTIDAVDGAASFDVPVQTSIYLGAGELEGGADLAGKRRPLGDGVVQNATPTLVIAAEGLYQFSTGASASVEHVKDGGISLVVVADYATVALLRNAVLPIELGGLGLIPPGSYATCLAESYFGIGGVAFKQVTVWFTGLRLTRADVIENVALTSAGLSASDLDAWTFEKLNDDEPGSIGYYLDAQSSENCAEMFTKLMAGIEGWWGFTTLQKLQVMRMAAPVNVAADEFDLQAGNLLEIDRVALPDAIAIPPRRRRLTYAHNWTVQTDLFGQVSEVDPELADYLSKPYLFASTTDSAANAILEDYPLAPDPEPVLSYYAEQADALAGAVRLLALYSSGYKLYRGRVKHALCMLQIGQVALLKDSSFRPRIGLSSSGKYARIVAANDDLKTAETEITAFG